MLKNVKIWPPKWVLKNVQKTMPKSGL
jgi:hypothetical protein